MLRKIAEALDKRHERKSLERLAAAFNEQMLAYTHADANAQIFAELSVRTVRHAFAGAYPKIHDFLEASHSEKSAHLDKLSNYTKRLAIDEEAEKVPQGVTCGALLAQFWITALAWNDFELADALAQQLEPLNRSAYETACAAGEAKPDELMIAKWKKMYGDKADFETLWNVSGS